MKNKTQQAGASKTAKLLASKGKLPFRYETKSPYARPIAPYLSRAVAMLRRRGFSIHNTLRLEAGFFVYYVHATQHATKTN